MGENVLVEGEQDERPIGIEVGVIEQGQEPISKPGSGICDISIVTIAAWCHEISIQSSIRVWTYLRRFGVMNIH